MQLAPTEDQLAVQRTAHEFATSEVLPKAAEIDREHRHPAQRTTAVRDGDGWVISGTKNWITNGPVADVCVLFTMNDRAAGHKGITAFILPMKARGVRCGPPDDKLGIRGSKSSQVFLDDVRLPDDALLGEVGGGFKIAMTTLDGGRIGIAAQAVGIARAALEDALAYAQQRRTFGKPTAA